MNRSLNACRSWRSRVAGLLRLAAFFSLISIALAGSAAAEAVGDYEVDLTVFQRDDMLHVRGRISYGPYCDQLKLKLKATCETGKTRSLTTIVEDVGGAGSRLIEVSKKVGRTDGRPFARWTIEPVSATCAD